MAALASSSLLPLQSSPPVCREGGKNVASVPSFSTPVLTVGLNVGRRSASCISRHSIKASAFDELPKELVEESKFVPLNDEDPSFGPPALLLVGFARDETSKILQFLKELEGEFLKIIHCTEDMLRLSVWEAMHTQQPDLEAVKIAKSLPRMCILSGLSGEEMMMFIDAFPESGLEPAVFAALVPNSANKPLHEVIEEIMGDYDMLSAGQPV